MTVQSDTRSGLWFGWLVGVSGWGARINQNFHTLAYQGTHVRVISTLSTPPTSPTEADCYIVGSSPTGAWGSFAEGSLAVWGHTSAGSATLQWINLVPKEGWAVYSRAHSGMITYDQSGSWNAVSALTPAQIATISNLNNQLAFSSWAQVARGLETLTGNDQFDYESLKNKPTTITTAQANLISSALQGVVSDSTITGTGTRGDPQAVAIPLTQAEKDKLGLLDTDLQLPTGGTTGQVVTRTATGREWQTLPSTSTTFNGITTDDTLTGTGVDNDTRVGVANPFTDDDEMKLDGIQAGAQVNRTLAEIVTLLNTLDTPTTTDDAKISYNILKDTPDPGTAGTLRTGNETVDLINAAATTQLISASKVSGIPDGTVNTEAPVAGDGGTGSPVTLDDDSKAKLGKLTTTQPSFVDPQNYQADMAEDNEQSFNFVRNKSAMGGGITEVKHDTTLTGKGIDGNLLVVTNPFTGVEFTQAEKDKLRDIQSDATDDQTAAEITAKINTITLEAEKIEATKIKNLPTGTQSNWNQTEQFQSDGVTPNYDYIIGKPDIPTVPPNLSTTLAGLRTDIDAIPARWTIDQIISGIEGKTGSARLDATKLKNLTGGGGSGLTEDQIRTLITEQAGERTDNVVQAVLDLASKHSTDMGLSLTFTNANSQTVTGAPAFAATGFTLLNIGTFDPIILDNRFIATLNAVAVGSTMDATQGRQNRTAVEFTMLRNGFVETATDGAGTEVAVKLQVGRTSSNAPLVALTSPTGVSYTADVRFRTVSAMELGQLSNVNLTNPTADHVIVRSGSNWVNIAMSALGTKVIAALATGSIPVDKITGLTTQLPAWSAGSSTLNTIKRGSSASDPYVWGEDANDGGGSSYTQAEIEEFARDAVADALTAGNNNDRSTDMRFTHQDSGGTGGTIKGYLKDDTIDPSHISQTSGVADSLTTWRTLFGITTTQGITEAQAEAAIRRLVENYAEVGTTAKIPESRLPYVVEDWAKTSPGKARIPDDRLSPKLQDFADALTGDEGFVDEGTTPAGDVAQVVQALPTSTTVGANAASIYTYGQYFENTMGSLLDNQFVVIRIPTARLADNTFRLVVETRTTGTYGRERYGEIYQLSDLTLIGVHGSYTYYEKSGVRIPGSERVWVQRYIRIGIDEAKFDIGVEDWAREGNTDLIPEAKLPEGTGGGNPFAIELLDATRGLTIASGTTRVQQPLTAFTTPLTLMSTDHGVILASLQARIAAGSTQQIRLGVTQSNSEQVFLSNLRTSSAYTGEPGTSGNGIQVAAFEVYSTAGVAQGSIHCYLARNAANQVGTYATYTPASGASGAVVGQIQIDWEVSLLRTDHSGGGAGGTLDSLSNVTISNPTDGQDLKYEAATSMWKNKDSTGGGGGSNTLAGLSDVNITTPIADKEYFQYDLATSKWINSGSTPQPVVPQPVTLPELFLTREASDPSDVITIRDTRGFLAETLPVGTTLNVWHGGTAMSQTAFTGSPWTIRNRISGGLRQTTQRIQLNKAFPVTTTAVPVTINTFNANAYYVTVGVRGTISLNVGDYHSYDAVESFDTQNSGGRGVNYNAVRNLVSVIDGGTPKRHYGYAPDSGGTPDSRYTQTLEGDPYGCAWDPDGRHLYVHDKSSTFRVYDFGASTNPSSITIARVTSREFDVSTWFSIIDGIQVTATDVIIIGKRFRRSPHRGIDRFVKVGGAGTTTGQRRTAVSDVYVNQFFGGAGILSNSAFNRTWSAAADGDHVDSLSHTTDATNLRWSLSTYWQDVPISQYDNAIVANVLYQAVGGRTLWAYSLTTGNRFSTTTPSVPSSSCFTIASAGSFLYMLTVESPAKLYRSNRAAGQSATPVLVTGTTGANWENIYWTSSYTPRMTILNDVLYILFWDIRSTPNRLTILSAPLTGSASAGYTAVGSATRTVATIGWVHNSNGYDLFRGFESDGTSIYASMGRRIDNTNDYGIARYDTSSGSFSIFLRSSGLSSMSLANDRDRSIFHVFNTNLGYAYDFSSLEAKTVIRERNRSFPLGVRQGSTYGFGYNSSQDEFYVGNTNQVNVYDKSQPTGLIRWQPNEALDINLSRGAEERFFILGNRLYDVGSSYIEVYEYPAYVFIQRINRQSGGWGRPFDHNGLYYDVTSGGTIRQFSLANGEWIGGQITLQHLSGFGANVVIHDNQLFAVQNARIRGYTLPTTGAIAPGTLNETRSFAVPSSYSLNGGLFIYNSTLWGATSGTTVTFAKFNLTTYSHESGADETVSYVGRNFSLATPIWIFGGNILYCGHSRRYKGLVRIV